MTVPPKARCPSFAQLLPASAAANWGPMGEDRLDELLLQELDDVEAQALDRLRRLRGEERALSEQRSAAVAEARQRIAGAHNPLLWGEPELQSATVLQNIAKARAELDLATASHDDVLRNVRETLDEVGRIQRERERILATRVQRQNLAVQRWLMIWTAVIALFTIGLFWRSPHG
jgi:hypothetical protein